MSLSYTSWLTIAVVVSPQAAKASDNWQNTEDILVRLVVWIEIFTSADQATLKAQSSVQENTTSNSVRSVFVCTDAGFFPIFVPFSSEMGTTTRAFCTILHQRYEDPTIRLLIVTWCFKFYARPSVYVFTSHRAT